jgi:hypothetical protein
MTNIEDHLIELRFEISEIADLERRRINLLNSPLNPEKKDERDMELKNEIKRQHQNLIDVIEKLIAFPPQHLRHCRFLDQFHEVAPYEKSVFVMTKFPDPKKPKVVDAQLAAVIKTVRDAVQSCGYVARLASDKQYHNILWDNVELYLLGCKRGIAIVEDRYLPELNPNVAMEWGWMRGMGRNVLYLVENNFKTYHADWGGLIRSPFDWANPGQDIKLGVEAWLKKPS